MAPSVSGTARVVARLSLVALTRYRMLIHDPDQAHFVEWAKLRRGRVANARQNRRRRRHAIDAAKIEGDPGSLDAWSERLRFELAFGFGVQGNGNSCIPCRGHDYDPSTSWIDHP